ncbi:MAG TPA: MFS transporter [Acetobacteraceae bacterium]|nr:MFS transporter [Acetobacteraceae bacterium]
MSGSLPGFGAVPIPPTIETRKSWTVCLTALGITAISFAAPAITVVGLRSIAEELGGERSVPALAYSLAWLGASFGGIAMGRAAERFGIRATVIFGSAMIAVGLIVAQSGGRVSLLLGYGLFIGLLGNSGINAPLYIYVSHWFDRRRGTALALVGSGASVSAAIWAPIFVVAEAHIGWRHTMLGFAVFQFVLITPTAALIFAPAPVLTGAARDRHGPKPGARVLGLRPGIVLGLLCIAGFLCCVPMAMPQGHLVAFCGDMGIPASQGAAMLSVLLGAAFVSRQFWGFMADRIGGPRTILAGSVCQITAMIGFLLTRNEAGLFMVSAWFGLGFSGIIPAYVLAVRDLFPASEASWRVPTVLLFSGSGMAFGGWLAGAIYDAVGFYAAAFAAGILFNVAHLMVIGTVVWRQHHVTTWSRYGLPKSPNPSR